MYILGKIHDPDSPELEHDQNANNTSTEFLDSEEITTKPTIIICCPNAGYYEFMCWEVFLFSFCLH
jgi:hypothetical protein